MKPTSQLVVLASYSPHLVLPPHGLKGTTFHAQIGLAWGARCWALARVFQERRKMQRASCIWHFLSSLSFSAICWSSKDMNPTLRLILAFWGKISAHCDKHNCWPSHPKSPTPLQIHPQNAGIRWGVVPARHKLRNINHSMSCA